MKNKLIFFAALVGLQIVFKPIFTFSQTDLEIVWQKNIFPTEISFAKFSADGQFIYYAVGNNILKMSAQTGDFVSTFDNKDVSGIYDMEISKTGNLIVTHNGGGVIDIWDVKQEKAIKHINFSKKPGYDGALAVDISPNEDYIIANVSEYIDFNQSKSYLTVYDLKEDKEIQRIDFNLGTTRNIKISHDGKYFVTGTYYQNLNTQKWYDKLILWETGTWKQAAVLEDVEGTSDGYRFIKFSKDDKYLEIVKQLPQIASIFDLSSNKLIRTSDSSRMCFNMEYLPDNRSYLFFYATWSGDYDLEYININNITKHFQIFAGIIESYGLENDFIVFCGGGKFPIILLKSKQTDVKSTINKTTKIEIIIENGKIILETSKLLETKINITISDLLGKIVYIENINIESDNSIYDLKTKLPNGIYICNVIASDYEYTQKIEIVR